MAAILMSQTGEVVYSLLSQFDERLWEFRIDSIQFGKRPLAAAHNLPVAIDQLLRGINSRIGQPKTQRQIHDLGFEVHFQLLTLHPFGGENGPIARMLINYIERYHNLPLSLVYVDLRVAYLGALEASWQQQSTVPFVSFMHSQLARLLEEGNAAAY